jgi:hypothetical protein
VTPAPAAPQSDGGGAFEFALLGASNLSLALPWALEHLARRFEGRDLRVFCAHGPGRSYGLEAGVLGVTFTALSRSGLAAAVSSQRGSSGSHRAWALLTDAGNDIPYGAGAESLLAWLRQTSAELLALGFRVAITSLPIESLEATSPSKFQFLRRLFFPFRPLSRSAALSQARAVQAGLCDLAAELKILLLPVKRSWFGFDPIHVRRRARREAFAAWIDALLGESADVQPPAAASSARRVVRMPAWRLRFLPPEEYRIFGRSRRRPQHGVPLAPGMRIFLY